MVVIVLAEYKICNGNLAVKSSKLIEKRESSVGVVDVTSVKLYLAMIYKFIAVSVAALFHVSTKSILKCWSLREAFVIAVFIIVVKIAMVGIWV